jgi:hypothetical protein
VKAEHIADNADTSQAAMAKPLVSVKGRVFERRVRLRTEQLGNEPQPEKPSTPKVSVDTLPKVLSNNPANVVPNSRRFVSGPSVRSARALVQCPECPNRIREDRFQKHLLQQHGTRKTTLPVAASAIRKSSSTAPGNTELPQKDGDEKLIQKPNYREERRLDGSRDYWQIREIGRFGSHPSYDNCDDESAP